MTSFKPGGGRAEDKVGGALDVALLVVLPALLVGSEQSVLVAQQPAPAEHRPVTVRMNCHRLPQRTGAVLEGDILGCESRTLNPDSIGTEGSHIVQTGIIVPGDDSLPRALSLHEKVGHPRRDENLFL